MTTFDPPRPWTASYDTGVPEDLPPVTGSLVDIVERSAQQHPHAPALDFFGRTTSYTELLAEIERVAGALADLGVRHGTRVALALPNCPQHVVAFYAVQRLGGVVIEHNPLYTAEELQHLFSDHRAQHAIVWDKVVPTIQAFTAELEPGTLISVDLTRGMPLHTQLMLRLPVDKARSSRQALHAEVRDTTDWESLRRHAPLPASVAKPDTEDLAVIQYTSGTTGRAKGVQLLHRNLIANAMQCVLFGPSIPHGEPCVVYGVLPMFHAYGLTLCQSIAMMLAARLVLFPKFDPQLMIKVSQKHPATLLPLVPPIADRLLKAAKDHPDALRGTGIAISGAMALDHTLIDPFEEATGGFLVEGYGLSECAPILMVNPFSDGRRAGTVGLPLPGTEIRIVDPDDPGVDREPGQPGELVARGPQVFAGYFGMPEETEAAFVDGWFRTGDVVVLDPGGYVRIVDRIKELIITGGFNVMPSEVEAAIIEHPAVAEVAAVGLPNRHSGEEVAVAIVVEEGAQVDPQEVREFARARLTPYKVPRHVYVMDQLPTSMIGKVIRREVREQLLTRQRED